MFLNIDGFVKSRKIYNFVIPVKLVLDPDRGTGIQSFQAVNPLWIPAYAGMADFLRDCQLWIIKLCRLILMKET